MNRVKEPLLNGLLLALVILSVGLSAEIWFPTGHARTSTVKEARVQVSPVPQQTVEPDLQRPERMYVRRKGNQVALLSAGSPEYRGLWGSLQFLLRRVRIATQLTQLDLPLNPDAIAVTVVFPVAVPMGEMVQPWGWRDAELRNSFMKTDRVTVYLDQVPIIHLAGASGSEDRVGQVPEADYKALLAQVSSLSPDLFMKYRAISIKDSTVDVLEGVLVPDTASVPLMRLDVRSVPDEAVEKARYFPDISVVRSIDEQNVRSFTDGQRLLRLTANGMLEYRVATNLKGASQGPNLDRAREAAGEWVRANGGWPSDVVLSDYRQQLLTTVMLFDLRVPDSPFPVETAQGFLRLEVSTEPGDMLTSRVTYFRRFPEFRLDRANATVSVITPEAAIQAVKSKLRIGFYDPVREIHLAYLIHPEGRPGESPWLLEPAWVLQVGEDRIYVPADTTSKTEPFVATP